MAAIIITRLKEYHDKFRKYNIYIDGEKAGTIGSGETKTFNVQPGLHTVAAKIDWCCSQTLAVNCTDTNHLTVASFKSKKSFFFDAIYFITIGRKEYLVLEEQRYN